MRVRSRSNRDGSCAAFLECLAGFVNADDAERAVTQPQRVADLLVEGFGGCRAEQQRLAARPVGLTRVEADALDDVEVVEQEAAVGVSEHEEVGRILGLNEALHHAADFLHLGHGGEFRANRLVDGTHDDVEGVRLAEHKIGLAAAQHRAVTGLQPLGERAERDDRRNAEADAQHGEECTPFSSQEVS